MSMDTMSTASARHAVDDVFFKPRKVVPMPTKDLLSWIFDDTTYPEDEPIYIDAQDPSHSISRKQAQSLVQKLIAGLRATSLAPGDCVCVHSFNNTEYELQHHLKTSKAKLVIAEPEIYDAIIPAARACNIAPDNVLQFDWSRQDTLPAIRARSWKILLQHGTAGWVRFDDDSLAKSTTACLLFSSGTTGLPKAAAVTHANLMAQHVIFQEQDPKPYKVSRILCLPFFHAAMVPLGHVTPLRGGQVSYVMRRFHLEDFLKYTDRYQVTEIFVVPPIVLQIVQSPLLTRYSLRSLRWGLTGGATVDLLSQKKFASLMHTDGHFNLCYGMTELSCIVACFPWPEDDVDSSIGYFLPNLEVMLMDDKDQEIRAYGVRGEIWVRGPTVVRSYLDNPVATASSFTGEWFHTGDIGYCDAKTKQWYIVDRKKEPIKVRGFQVAPPELETMLMSHPLILDVAIIGVPAPQAIDGEVPRAYIVRKNDATHPALSTDEVKQFVARRLVKYKQLTGGVVFVDSLPKTASGKFLKRQLRDLAKREMQTGPNL